MYVRIGVGIDLGGTKMLAIAISPDRQHQQQIATGKDFTTTDAEIAIARSIDTLPAPPHSIDLQLSLVATFRLWISSILINFPLFAKSIATYLLASSTSNAFNPNPGNVGETIVISPTNTSSL